MNVLLLLAAAAPTVALVAVLFALCRELMLEDEERRVEERLEEHRRVEFDERASRSVLYDRERML